MTMTITTTPLAGPGRRHDVVSAPNYVLRRVVVAAAVAVAVVTVVLLAATLAAVGGEPAAASDATAASSSATVHVARPGDTLWSIAARHRGAVDHGRYVEALIDLNGGTAVEVGQAIRLP